MNSMVSTSNLPIWRSSREECWACSGPLARSSWVMQHCHRLCNSRRISRYKRMNSGHRRIFICAMNTTFTITIYIKVIMNSATIRWNNWLVTHLSWMKYSMYHFRKRYSSAITKLIWSLPAEATPYIYFMCYDIPWARCVTSFLPY